MSEVWAIFIVGFVLAMFQGLFAYIFKQQRDRGEETRKMIEDHIKQCSETPNKSILDRINELISSMDNKHGENKESLNKVGQDMAVLRDKVEDQGKNLAVVIDRMKR